MDESALSRLALAIGVGATLAAGGWSLTGSAVVGAVTIALLVAVIAVQLMLLARPVAEQEPRSERPRQA